MFFRNAWWPVGSRPFSSAAGETLFVTRNTMLLLSSLQGLPPGALLPLVGELRTKIIEAAAKGDVETLVEIRSTELETHARDEVLDEVAAALTALADEGEDEKG